MPALSSARTAVATPVVLPVSTPARTLRHLPIVIDLDPILAPAIPRCQPPTAGDDASTISDRSGTRQGHCGETAGSSVTTRSAGFLSAATGRVSARVGRPVGRRAAVVDSRHDRAGAGTAAAPRRARPMRPSGWRPTGRARCEVLGPRRAHLDGRAVTTTRWWSSTGCRPAPARRTTCALDGELVWPPADDDAPGPAGSAPCDPDAAAADRLRVLPLRHPDARRGRPATSTRRPGRATPSGWLGCRTTRWPDALLLLGDQVYADETSDAVQDAHPGRAATSAVEPDEQVKDYEEYTWLYEESWTDPDVRWLLVDASRRR